MNQVHPSPRSGAALIIALVILVGMMLLGLPFLFSQSASVASARSLQAAQAARIYDQAAMNLGTALAIYANQEHWRSGGKQLHTALDQYFAVNYPLALGGTTPASPTVNHLAIDPSVGGFNLAGAHAHVGLALEDESGKLDANALGPQGWADLLAAVGIPDWDDDFIKYDQAWPGNTGPDGDQIGELANALTRRRLYRGKFTSLEDLLSVNPQTDTAHGTVSGHTEFFRKRMTRAEVELLRPYLSFHNRAPGRNGLIDLGSVIYLDSASQLTGPNTAAFTPQQVWLDIRDAPINDDTWMEVESAPNAVHGTGVVQRWKGGGNNADRWVINYDYHITNNPQIESGVFIQAPPPLNLHQMPQLLRNLPAYRGALMPGDLNFPTAPLITYYGQQTTAGTNDLPLAFLAPRYLPDNWQTLPPRFPANGITRTVTERQPLDIRSGGAIIVEHAATITDINDTVIAQESRRTVIQAVPQEGVLERRWETQGQLQPLIDQRFGSHMVSWPMATHRASDVQVDDVDPASNNAPKAETGFSFETNPTLATKTAAFNATHLNRLWWVNMGNGDATIPKAQVLKDSQGNDPVQAYAPSPDQNPATQEGLYPDGVRLGQGTRLAYSFDSSNKGPLAWTSANDSSMALRSISVWFKPEDPTVWSSGVVTILEARANPATVTSMSFTGVDPRDGLQSTDNTNFFGVLYDSTQNMLVLAYGTPGASFAPQGVTNSILPNIGVDDPTTPTIDERSMAGITPLLAPRQNRTNCSKWSPTLLPNRILTCYKLGNRSGYVRNLPEIGRWYHLQVTMANGRPGGLGLILDGIAGTDVGLMSAKDYLAKRQATGPLPGDHLTLPGLVLDQDLPSIDRPIAHPETSLQVDPILVAMPGFSPFMSDDYSSAPAMTLTAQGIMPHRGSVLIGDEYIRYQDIDVDTTTGVTKLRHCSRGDRQNTWTTSTNIPDRDPLTESHVKGNRVIPDGCRLQPSGTGNLYRGGATTVDALVAGPDTDRCAVIGHIQNPGIGIDLTVTNPLTVDSGFNAAPKQGFLKLFDTSGRTYYYYYTKKGSDLTLEIPVMIGGILQPKHDDKLPLNTVANGRMLSNTVFDNNPAKPKATVTWISLCVDTTDPLTATTEQWFRWPHGGGGVWSDQHLWSMFQIADGTGRCEWVRYTDIIHRGTDYYFISRDGWTYEDGSTPAQRARGLCRTQCDPSAPFAAESIITPVQTGVMLNGAQSSLDYQTKLLSPGDLITLVRKDYSGPSIVAAVRFAATDGYAPPTPPAAPVLDPNTDTVNGQFACTQPLRSAAPDWNDYEIVMGSGLNTQLDLTPLNTAQLPPSAPPQLKAHEIGTEPGRLVFGGADDARGGTASTGLVMSIDAPTAAQPFAGKKTFASFLRRVIKGSSCVDQIADSGDLPIHIQIDKNDQIFAGPERMGLVEVGGEVFAWRRTTMADQDEIRTALTQLKVKFSQVSVPAASPAGTALDPDQKAQTDNAEWANFVTLVGRGLLGSDMRAHPVDQSQKEDQLSDTITAARENLDRGQEVMRLPVGPVRTLLNPPDLANNDWFEVSVDGTHASSLAFTAPAVLVADPLDGSITEIIRLAGIDTRQSLTQWISGNQVTWTNKNFNKWLTASWLRGMYNTPKQTWALNGTLQPILIGWWTRYPSALPNTQLSGAEGAAQLRCRSYPWIGFPLHVARARFDNGTMPFQVNFNPGLTVNEVLTTNPTLQVEIRAMAGAIDGDPKRPGALENGASLGDWQSVNPVVLPVGGAGGWTDIANLFTWNVAGQPNETEGVEVRVAFRYTTTASSNLEDIARAANRAPLISGAKLRFHAPVTTLGAEHAR